MKKNVFIDIKNESIDTLFFLSYKELFVFIVLRTDEFKDNTCLNFFNQCTAFDNRSITCIYIIL